MGKHITIEGARKHLATYGCTLTKKDGEYKVRIKGSPREQGYFTDDINDAVITGMRMGTRRQS